MSLFNLLIALVALTAYSQNSPHQNILFNYLPIFVWVALIGSFLLLVYLASVGNSTILVAGLSALLSVLLVELPNITTGTLYGPDSYGKAAVALNVVQTGTISNLFYPGNALFSGINTILLNTRVWVVPLFAFAVLAPFAGMLLARRFPLAQKDVRLITIFCSLLPLAFGLWQSTRSIFQTYYYAFPLAMIAIALMYRLSVQPRPARSILLTVALIAVSLFHPLLFIVIFVFVMVTTPFVAGDWGDTNSLREHIRTGYSRYTIFPLLISALYLIYMQFTALLDWIGVYFLTVFGVFSPEILEANMKVCLPSAGTSVPVCTNYWMLGMLAVPVLLFGTATGLVGRRVIIAVRSLYKGQPLNRGTLNVTLLYFFFGGALVIVLFAPIKRNLAMRVLAFSTLFGFLTVMLSCRLFNQEVQTTPRLVHEVYAAGVVVFLVASFVVIRVVDVAGLSYFAISGVIAAVAVLSYVIPDTPISLTRVPVAILLITALVIPLMYPVAPLNGVPNHTWEEPVHQETAWIANYDKQDAKYASATRQFALHRYVSGEEDVQEYVGSVYLMSRLASPPDANVVRWNTEREGRVVASTQMDYILLTPFAAQNVKGAWRENGIRYTQVRSVTSETVERRYPYAKRIYVASDNTSVYQT